MFTEIAWTVDAIIFAFLACAGLFLLILSLVLGEMLDIFDWGGDGMFSVQTLAGYIAGFGAIGWYITGYTDHSPSFAALVGFLAAVPIGGIAYCIERLFKKSAGASGFTMEDAIGSNAIVTLALPGGSGAGKVRFSIKGATHTVTARASDGQAYPEGSSVVVSHIVGGECIISKP